jgi:gliding motility-associated-like protein
MNFFYYSISLAIFLLLSGNIFSQCCGDGNCDPGEDAINCPSDCGGSVGFNCPNTIGSFYDSPSWPITLATAQSNSWCYTIMPPYPSTVCFEYIVPPVTEPVRVSFIVSSCNTSATNQGNSPGGCNSASISNSIITSSATYDNNCNLISNNVQTGGCYNSGDIITVCLNINTSSSCSSLTICPVLSCGTSECATTSSAPVCPPFDFTSNFSYADVCDANSGTAVVTSNCGSHFTYQWNDPLAQTDSLISGLSAGTYTATIINTAFPNCDTTMSVTLAPISGLSIDNVTPVNPTCFGDCNGSIDLEVSGGSGTYSYTWQNQSGSTVGADSPTLSNVCAGNYSVEISDGSCIVSASYTLTEPPLASPSFSFDNFCAGTTNSPANVTPSGGVFSFNPVPSDGATINASTGVITNGVGGTTYTVQYTVNGSTCPESTTQAVEIYTNPQPTISGTFTFCPGGNATLDAGAGYASYNWSIGGASQTITTGAASNITVTVTNINGCQGTSSPVTVTESTNIVHNSIVEICAGGSAFIHGVEQTTAATYTETFPGSLGCDSISNVQLIVHPLPTPVITGNLIYCEGQTAILDAGSYASYSWSTGDNTQVISTTTDSPITVTVIDIHGCEGTSNAVSLVSPPIASVVATPSEGEVPLTVDFTNNSQNASSYHWDFGNDSTLTINNTSSQTQIYDSVGTYVIILVAEQNGCTDTAYVTITVTNERPVVISFPNVFTPNGDETNDFFLFNGQNIKQLEVLIVNRWGQEVYHSQDINFQWDGRSQGKKVTEGVYFYYYKITGVNDELFEGHDFVHVEY